MATKKKTVIKKARVSFPEKGKIFVTATFNNTLVTVTDEQGSTLVFGSAGKSGFKGTRKATPYAATLVAEKAARVAREQGLKEVAVFVKGPGPGRDAALRAIRSAGLSMSSIADTTPIPHNGIRAKKRRRV
ncbi:30S ribosomal protein S11 [Candidatus Microgenomates bacterium]|nr:30S ribosomal protein S11 [Candidatus Microgenomates bacterium]